MRRFATLFSPPVDAAPLLQRFGLQPDDAFAVVCAGGGGHADASTLFGDAATQLAHGGLATIAVGVRASTPAIEVPSLPNADLMALLATARVALLAGGSLLVQALALAVPSVAVPLQREQAARVRWLAAAGAVHAVPPTASAQELADALRALADDADGRARLQQAARRLGLENGLDAAVAALAQLAGAA